MRTVPARDASRQRETTWRNRGGASLMATAPRAFCLVIGCRQRTVAGSRKCAMHRTPAPARVVEPVYHTVAWHRARSRALRDQPWCAWCGATERLSVDHVLPLSQHGTHEQSNLRVLCLSCHGRRSAEQAHGRRDWVRPDGTVDKSDRLGTVQR